MKNIIHQTTREQQSAHFLPVEPVDFLKMIDPKDMPVEARRLFLRERDNPGYGLLSGSVRFRDYSIRREGEYDVYLARGQQNNVENGVHIRHNLQYEVRLKDGELVDARAKLFDDDWRLKQDMGFKVSPTKDMASIVGTYIDGGDQAIAQGLGDKPSADGYELNLGTSPDWKLERDLCKDNRRQTRVRRFEYILDGKKLGEHFEADIVLASPWKRQDTLETQRNPDGTPVTNTTQIDGFTFLFPVEQMGKTKRLHMDFHQHIWHRDGESP